MHRSIVFTLLLLACSKPDAMVVSTSAPDATAPAKGEGLGTVMAQVGRRFELAGRAERSDRFELAAFEVGELEELFDGDVPNAEMPKEGPTSHIPKMAAAFRSTNLTELDHAASTKDAAAFERAFAHAAEACNACHRASEKAFIEVPTETGKPVPNVDPLSVDAGVRPTAPASVKKAPKAAAGPEMSDPFGSSH
jgi:hypothetical protein